MQLVSLFVYVTDIDGFCVAETRLYKRGEVGQLILTLSVLLT